MPGPDRCLNYFHLKACKELAGVHKIVLNAD